MPYADPAKTRAYQKAYSPGWRARNAKKIKITSAAGYQLNRVVRLEQMRWAGLLRRRGVTKEQYLAMLEKQGGVCGCCGKPPRGRMSLAVDHCHETGRVRGLLCNWCNPMVERIMSYLAKSEKVD